MSLQTVILASGSAQRKLLFSALGLPFQTVPADVDEKAIRDPDLAVRAEKIARAKAQAVLEKHPGIVVAADTFVGLAGHVLEKPIDSADAKRMLKKQSGQWIQVYTGFCYLDRQNAIDVSGTAVIHARFREIDDQEIDAYVAASPVTTWSAAFSPAYPYGATLLAEVSGSLTGLTNGLPMERLIPLLKRSGYAVAPSSADR